MWHTSLEEGALSLLLTVPDEIATAARELSHRSGSSPEELLLRALRAHFPPIPAELAEEFDAWEQASDHDLSAFEQKLKDDTYGSR